MVGTEVERRYSSTHSQLRRQMGVGSEGQDPAALPSGKGPGIQCTEGCLDSRAGVWMGVQHRKSFAPSPIPGLEPRPIQPIPIRLNCITYAPAVIIRDTFVFWMSRDKI